MNKMSKGAQRDSYRQTGDSITGNHIAVNTNSNQKSNSNTTNTTMHKHIQSPKDTDEIIAHINSCGLMPEKEVLQKAIINIMEDVDTDKLTAENYRDYTLSLGLAWENFKSHLFDCGKPLIYCLDCTLRAIVTEALDNYFTCYKQYEDLVEDFIYHIDDANTLYQFDDSLALCEWLDNEVCADLRRQLKVWLRNERPDLLRFIGMPYSDIKKVWDGVPIYMGDLPLLALKNRCYIGEDLLFSVGDVLNLGSLDIFMLMETLDDNNARWDWVTDAAKVFFCAVA